ncbi:conjugal transfer protein TraX [[Clostridium] innocuum]|nr:conjugal transfer protein TraX [[Clostridium] innocuum]MCR0578667.1 conjugal transfer protein TraX [[Clostridium] innocuum]
METTRTTVYRLRKQMKNITLNQASLKLIAMGLMLLDHMYKILCFDILDFLLAHTAMPQEVIQWGIQLIGMLGAVSFWIFAFFIAEGCRRTRNRSAYLIRLLIMGLISEIPFQYMICILLDAPLTLHLALTNIFSPFF